MKPAGLSTPVGTSGETTRRWTKSRAKNRARGQRHATRRATQGHICRGCKRPRCETCENATGSGRGQRTQPTGERGAREALGWRLRRKPGVRRRRGSSAPTPERRCRGPATPQGRADGASGTTRGTGSPPHPSASTREHEPGARIDREWADDDQHGNRRDRSESNCEDTTRKGLRSVAPGAERVHRHETVVASFRSLHPDRRKT